MKRVAIIMGSASDRSKVVGVPRVLDQFGVQWEWRIMSAHRTPEEVASFAANAQMNGFGVLICAAGLAAHLAGVVAGHTSLPVIGIPLAAGPLHGQDALLATVQMPPGVPVATVGLNNGANAAHLAIRILALEDSDLQERLRSFQIQQREKVSKADGDLDRDPARD